MRPVPVPDATDFRTRLDYTESGKGVAHISLMLRVMGLYFLVELLLILGTNRLTGQRSEIPRSIPAAALGGLYSGLCLVPGLRFLMGPAWHLGSLMAVGLTAFGWRRGNLRRCGFFLMLSLALGGLTAALGEGRLWLLPVCAVGLWLLCLLASQEAEQQELLPLRIRRGDKRVELTALRDTGNRLRDPITGEQVLVIGPEAARILTGLTREQLCMPIQTLATAGIPGLRLVPYRTVGQPGGMLLALRFREVEAGTKRQAALVAFAPEDIGEGEAYQALIGGSV